MADLPNLHAHVLARLDHLEAVARAAEDDRDHGVIINFDSALTEHMHTWEPDAVTTFCSGARTLVEYLTHLPGPADAHQAGENYAKQLALHHVARMLDFSLNGDGDV